MKTKILSKDLPLLQYNNNINSNLQIVCNYLKLIEENKINDIDLIFPGMTHKALFDNEEEKRYNKKLMKKNKIIKKEDLVSKYINAKVLSQEECQDLIYNVFKKDEKELPSFYQINAFINVLAEQLKLFNKNFYLSSNQLQWQNFRVVRSYILESFIYLTKFFTRAAFTKLLNEQNITHKKMYGEYDEQNDIENEIKAYQKYEHNIISFNSIKSTLIFFMIKAELYLK